jgi:multiple sugar transport system permease protein
MMAKRAAGQSILLSRKRRKLIKDIIGFILVIIFLSFILFPFFWSFTCSLRPNRELYSKIPRWLPNTFTLENYVWAFKQRDFRVSFTNTIWIAIANGVASVTVASIAAYSLARYRYPGKGMVLSLLLGQQMLPGVVLLLSIFVIFRRLNLYDTPQGLIIAFASSSIPYSILLLRSFFSTIPVDLEEQAMVDGASRLGAFLRVTLPLAWPSLVAVFLFDFISVWGDLTYSLILTTKPERRIVGVQILIMSQDIRASVNWGGLIAAANAVSLPGVILFIFLQRYLVEGITAGAMKG